MLPEILESNLCFATINQHFSKYVLKFSRASDSDPIPQSKEFNPVEQKIINPQKATEPFTEDREEMAMISETYV